MEGSDRTSAGKEYIGKGRFQYRHNSMQMAKERVVLCESGSTHRPEA